jgi:hypothetical protein
MSVLGFNQSSLPFKIRKAAATASTSLGGGRSVVVFRSSDMDIRIRRFDPFGGVSRHMIVSESKHLAQEMQSYMLLSLNELKQKLSERGEMWHHADEALHAAVLALPERDRLAVQCLLIRDQVYLQELYLEYLRTTQPEGVAPIEPPAEAPSEQLSQAHARHLAFNDWLFDS